MAQPQINTPDKSIIPYIACPRCETAMRLTFIEPTVMSASGADMLVFGCRCGFSYKRPMQTGL
jgi:hypothetical protein